MSEETYACYLLLGDDLDPDTVSEYLGLTPTRAWRKGDASPDSGPQDVGGWLLGSDLPRDCSEEDHVLALFQALRPSWLAAASLGARYRASLYVVVRTSSHANPVFNFDRSTVRQAAELNAELGVDLYLVQ